MKKYLFLFFTLFCCVIVLAGCGEKTYEIALVTDIGDIDDKSFNQGAWEGVLQYAEEHNISHKYYKPTAQTDDDYVAAIELAISGGAQIVVTPGYLFEMAIDICQERYPEVKFVLLDGNPENADYNGDWVGEGQLLDNTYSVFYAEEQVGYLAGYAAVKEGYTKLGFMGGMAVPAVQRYGLGYVQGANQAAIDLNIDNIDLKYHYTGDFAETPVNQSTAATMYEGGTEVIFACGGKVGLSVMAAAQAETEAGKKVIGVDVDQSEDSPTVITSATKNLSGSVYEALTAFYDGNWDSIGGTSVVLDAAADGVGLVMDNARLDNFTTADYDTLFGQLVNGDITILTLDPTTTDDLTDMYAANEIPGMDHVTVTMIATPTPSE